MLHAATPEETQFQQLKQQRAKTTAGTSQMLDDRYRMSLESMLRLAAVASQPELARQIQAELQATAGAKAAAAATAKPAAFNAARPATKAELKKLFENSQWRVTSKTGGEAFSFLFIKDGKCSVSIEKPGDNWKAFQFWEVDAPDVLKIIKDDPKKNRKSPFRALRVDFEHKTAKVDASLGGDPASDLTIAYDQPVDRKK